MSTINDVATTLTVDKQLNELTVTTPKAPEKHGPGGAPLGNQNSYKHGLRSTRLGPGMAHIARKAGMFRKFAETEVLNARGRIGVWEESLLQSATQWLISALKIDLILRVNSTTLTIDQTVNYTEKVSRALVERDRCLQRLGMDKGDEALTTLYASLPDATGEPEPAADGEQPGPEATG